MIAVLSPAKLLEEKTRYPELPYTLPALLDQSEVLVKKLRTFSAKKLGDMMGISPELSDVNKRRYTEWNQPFTRDNAKQALLMFSGDVYRGLDAKSLSADDLLYAQDHVRILSGLYGVLRPLDLIQPYRLMMGTPFSPSAKKKNLYEFWGDTLVDHLEKELQPADVLIRLASSEYFKALKPSQLKVRVITCDFKERKGGKEVGVQTYVKLARGYMARYIIENRVEEPELLKEFNVQGYHFTPGSSSTDNWVFVR